MKQSPFNIIYEDEILIVIDKPPRVHTHPPLEGPERVPYEQNGMALVRDYVGAYVYPVHRLDYATSGLLCYAKAQPWVRPLMESFARREVQKSYLAIVRGWLDDAGVLDRPLTHPKTKERTVDAITGFRTLERFEIPECVDRYPQARYSYLHIDPKTGRRNQIRRHLCGAGHPIIGDHLYGARKHNLYFEKTFGQAQLFLRAVSLAFDHPQSKTRLQFEAGKNQAWDELLLRLNPYRTP